MNAPLHVYRMPELPLLVVREETTTASESAGTPRTAESAGTPRTPGEPETVSDWQVVHRRMTELGVEHAGHERDRCRWLLAADRLGVFARAGYGSLCEYAERILGLSGRQTEERLRVGRALAELPALDGALARGELSWSAVRELTRVALPRTEAAWLGWAKGRRSKEVERAVAARRSGDMPSARPDPSRVTHRLRFEVRAETMALFRDLEAAVRADILAADGPRELDDDALLYEIARRALGGAPLCGDTPPPGRDAGRASYQVAVSRCDSCREVSIDAGGQSHPVQHEVAEMMACDSQQLGPVDGQQRRPHVGAKTRASQTVPPAVRRGVLRRDRGRCRVDGCRHHLFLDVHHIHPRAEGGSHDPERLITLCGRHHRAAHRGSLVIDGSASTGFRFRHADGTPYGQQLQPAAIDVAQQVLSALSHMGFKATQARALVDAVLREGAPDDAASFLRAALRAS